MSVHTVCMMNILMYVRCTYSCMYDIRTHACTMYLYVRCSYSCMYDVRTHLCTMYIHMYDVRTYVRCSYICTMFVHLYDVVHIYDVRTYVQCKYYFCKHTSGLWIWTYAEFRITKVTEFREIPRNSVYGGKRNSV